MPSLLPEIATEAGQAALGLAFGEGCALCRELGVLPGLPALCRSCAGALPRLADPRCRVCGEGYAGVIPGPFRCTNCSDRPFAFEFAVAPFHARRGLRELVHFFKYQRQLWLGGTLGALLATALSGPHADPRLAGETDWLLVPVPLHPRRLREREFNQARELADVAGRLTGCAVVEALERTRYTTGQAHLTRQDRLHNLRGAFRMRPARPWRPAGRSLVEGRAVLLIDDIFTTGATMDECARVLTHHGRARRVAALTVARG